MAVLISPDWLYRGVQKIKRKSLLILLTVAIITGCHSAVFEREIRPAHPSSQVPCRMVKHVMGETCIPNHLERIIAISQFTLANTLALGIKPIAGAFALSDVDGIPLYLQAYTQDIKQLGNQYTPNLEKIALLKPDLILGWQPIRKFYPLLAEISPTAVVPWKGPATPSWQEHFKFLAEALGKEHEHRQAWIQYYERIERLKAALGDRYQNKEISLININGNEITSYVKNSFPGLIFDNLGLKRPQAQSIVIEPLGRIAGISEEQLDKVIGDIVFVMVYRDRDKKFLEELQQKPTWKTLKAVQEKQVYSVDTLTWVGSNLIAANAVLDDLEKYLVNAS